MNNLELYREARFTRPERGRKPGPDFRKTARLSWDTPRAPYRPSPHFLSTVTTLVALILLIVGVTP